MGRVSVVNHLIQRAVYQMPLGALTDSLSMIDYLANEHGVPVCRQSVTNEFKRLAQAGWLKRVNHYHYLRTDPAQSKTEAAPENPLAQFTFEQLAAEINRRLQTKEA